MDPHKLIGFMVDLETIKFGWSTQSKENLIHKVPKTTGMETMVMIRSMGLLQEISFSEIQRMVICQLSTKMIQLEVMTS